MMMKSAPTLLALLLAAASFHPSNGQQPADKNKERPKILGYQPLSTLVLSNVSLFKDLQWLQGSSSSSHFLLITSFQLDLDHFEMGRHLQEGTEESFVKAKRVYEEGAHTKPFAILTLLAPLEIELHTGDKVAGETPTGETVSGTVLGDFAIGSLEIAVIYNASTRNCSVGASWNPQTEGCKRTFTLCLVTYITHQIGSLCFTFVSSLSFAGFKPSGSVFLKDRNNIPLPYNYNPVEDNQNRMSLQRLSTHAKDLMYVCNEGNCPFHLYAQYVDYYGNFTYADHWIQAAFNGGKTNLDAFNGDFQHYGFEARAGRLTLYTFDSYTFDSQTLFLGYRYCLQGNHSLASLDVDSIPVGPCCDQM